MLRLDRLRALVDVYPGVEREDEMVAAFDYCLWGKGGAAPSIDTAMHGLVDAAHVDHLHPDAGIAFAAAADGEALTRACFGDLVAWVPWRRPGFQLGLDIAQVKRDNPRARSGSSSAGTASPPGAIPARSARHARWSIIATAQRYLDEHGDADPFGPGRASRCRSRSAGPGRRNWPRSSGGSRPPTTGRSGTSPTPPPCWTSCPAPSTWRLAALGTSCPDHFLRTKVRPLLLDLPPDAPYEAVADRLRELHEAYRADYRAYYERYADSSTPPMRGADPAIVLVPGVGMFSFGADAQTARVAGEFYLNAINVMRGAEAVSVYEPIPESEKFRIEYWELEEDKLRRRPAPKPLAGRIALVTGGGSGIGRATAQRLAAEGACVVVADRDRESARDVAAGLNAGLGAGLGAGLANPADVAIDVTADVTDEAGVADAFAQAALAFGGVDLVVNNAGLSISKPLLETSAADWDIQHDVMARGSFLVSRQAARIMTAQDMGGDIIYICSKNAVFAGPSNIAYGAAKADQAHQVRLLAAELGGIGVRVNGINPDGVVRGSGIFSSGWGAQRAAVYGVPEDELGAFYAQRTLLKREVLPEHVAAAVAALCAGDLALTTGLLIPVDAGVPAAFLR